uniref:Mitochondrial ribosomal protein L32 n=1 Tax=Bos taurus TaxID=9913 RepID=A0AAA9S0E7_BOVIN
MAPTMLVLLVPPFPVARGLLRNCWKQLQGKLLQSRPGFSSPPWGPALAVQGPAIFSEPTNDTSGSTETSSLLDSIFWMAAPKNRRSIEVNRCRRRNPHKLIKVKGFPGSLERLCLQCWRPRFDLPWVGKIPWRREWQPTPVFLPGKPHGQRSLASYSPWDHKGLAMTERLTLVSFRK